MTNAQDAIKDQIPVPVADVKVEAIDGELLLYHPRDTRAIYLNPSAAVIWSLCDGQRRVSDIIQLIGEGYPEAGDSLTEQVLATLAQFRDNGVLHSKP